MARVTTVITSINSNTSEAVTINTAWTGTDGDLVLSAAVPASVKVGDTITDSAGNTYLITGISGSNLTSQDFDTTTDPATGAATIQEAYATFTLWEADLNDTILYVTNDTAQGEPYDNVTFSETFGINTTSTFTKIILDVPEAERHDGTPGTGVRIDGNASQSTIRFAEDNIELHWLEVFNTSSVSANEPLIGVQVGGATTGIVLNHLLLHDAGSADNGWGIDPTSANNAGVIMNSILYNMDRGLVGQDGGETNWASDNVTIFNTDRCILRMLARNTIGMDGATSDFFDMGTGTDYCLDVDGTAPGANSVNSKVAANQFVSTTGGSEDLHLKSGADAIDVGLDLGTTPTGVNFDIDNRDRDAEGDTWDIGADEFVEAAGVSNTIKNQILTGKYPHLRM